MTLAYTKSAVQLIAAVYISIAFGDEHFMYYISVTETVYITMYRAYQLHTAKQTAPTQD